MTFLANRETVFFSFENGIKTDTTYNRTNIVEKWN